MNLVREGGITEPEHPDKVVLFSFPLGGRRLRCLCHVAVSADPKQDSGRKAQMCTSVNQKMSGFQVRELAEK